MKFKLKRVVLLSIVLFSSVFLKNDIFCQELKKELKAEDIKLSWAINQNNFGGKTQNLSTLVIKNVGFGMLWKKGWKIYFNPTRFIPEQQLENGFHIKHVNGDLFCLEPTLAFKGLNGGDAINVAFISSEWVVNKTDAPQGFFLVKDDQPDKAFAIADPLLVRPVSEKQGERMPGDKIQFANAASTYFSNEKISDIPLAKLPKIFPAPKVYKESSGKFTIDQNTSIFYPEVFKNEALKFSEMIKALSGIKLQEVDKEKSNAVIFLHKASLKPEAYQLNIQKSKIEIYAADAAGAFYAVQSLHTMLSEKKQQSLSFNCAQVEDEPRFSYRGFMMEVARNFQPKKEVLKVLDLMALYKLNTLHFHLNDDEGWRIEIPSLPELTSFGSKRAWGGNALQPSFGSGAGSNNSGSGFYTQQDFVEILKYAAERHITIIPEIESPGHARAAIKSMDFRYHHFMKEGNEKAAKEFLLHDFADSSKYLSVQYWTDNVVDVSMPSVYHFLETVVDDLSKTYKRAGLTLKTVHFGGDEVPKGVWEKSPSVNALMETNSNIKNVDDLWPYYFGKLNAMLQQKNMYLSGWEEIGLKKEIINQEKQQIINQKFANKNMHLDVWNNMIGWGNEDLAYKLANAGYKTVLTCVSNLYFDMAYNKDFEEPGFYWGAYVDLDKPFSFIPFDYLKNAHEDRMGQVLSSDLKKSKVKLTDEGRKNILGLQGALWSETIKSPNLLEYMLTPKILALAQRSWSENPQWATEENQEQALGWYQQDWSVFVNVLGKKELPRLNTFAGGFNYRIPLPGAMVKNGKVWANIQIPGLEIRYTTDGTEPNENSAIYTKPIKSKGMIRLKAFALTGRSGRTVTLFN